MTRDREKWKLRKFKSLFYQNYVVWLNYRAEQISSVSLVTVFTVRFDGHGPVGIEIPYEIKRKSKQIKVMQ